MQYASVVAESFWNYLMRITDNASGVAISRAAEVDAGNVSRWKTGKTKPGAESVVKIARVWHRPPVEALVASGHLEATEVNGVVEVGLDISQLTDEELLNEIKRRMGARHGVEATTQQDAPSEADEDQKTVVELPRAARRGGSSEGRARRRKQDEDAEQSDE